MLILPIVNKRKILNVEVKLKNAQKIRCGVCYDDAAESEIIVNREKYSESSFHKSKEENAPTDFIRSKSILYPRNFLVTTKEERDSTLYDVYEVSQPPKKVNAGLDKLYGKAITDLQKEIPGSKNRGRYVSFSALGIGDNLTDEKIALLQKIVKEERNQSIWSKRFREAGISDLHETVDFINNFEYTILSEQTIPEDSLQDTLKALEAINTRDYRNLNNFYKMAKSNTDIITKISYINKVIYDKPLSLISNTNAKRLIKKKDEIEYNKAA